MNISWYVLNLGVETVGLKSSRLWKEESQSNALTWNWWHTNIDQTGKPSLAFHCWFQGSCVQKVCQLCSFCYWCWTFKACFNSIRLQYRYLEVTEDACLKQRAAKISVNDPVGSNSLLQSPSTTSTTVPVDQIKVASMSICDDPGTKQRT